MSIQEARVQEILEKLAHDSLVEGRMPTTQEILRRFQDEVRGTNASSPRVKLRPQGYRSRFNRDNYNKTWQEVLEDLELLYAESVDTAVRVLRGLNADDVAYRALRYQLSLLDDALENLLLIEPGATGYFFGVFDTFSDVSKVDLSGTTAEVDLESGSVRLPTAGGVNRLDLGFLRDRVGANPTYDPPQVLQVKPVEGTQFGYIFDDLIGTAWAVEVLTNHPGPQSVEFIIPVYISSPYVQGARTLPSVESLETQISRVEIDPLAPGPMMVDLLGSIDGRNWMRFPGYTAPTEANGRRLSFSFEPTLTRHMKVRLSKAPDAQLPGQPPVYRYTFGLRGLGVYNSGYASYAELVSKALQSSDTPGALVSRVALDVDERVPAGTDMLYFVKRGTAGWHEISPGVRDTGAPKTVEFGTSGYSSRSENRRRVQATPSVYATKNGITFYELMTFGNTPKPRSSRLFRGIDAWKRSPNVVEDVKTIRNNYVVFTLSDNKQQLYLEVEDESVSPPDSDGINPTYVTLANEIFKDPSVPVVPVANSSRENPVYSVRQVTRLYMSAVGGADANVVGDPTGGRPSVALPLSGANKVLAGQWLYLKETGQPGRYFEVVRVYENATPLVIVNDPERVLVTASGVTWSVGYEDITSSVQDVDGNRVVISSTQTLSNKDKLVVSYRRPLGIDEELVTASVSVRNQASSGSEVTVYEAGRDYAVDPESRTISRLPEGRITPMGDQVVVRVDFQYKSTAVDLDTYTGFLLVESAEPKVIELASILGLDEANGERILVDNGLAMTDVTKSLRFPALPKGWRQVVVRSKPCKTATGVTNTSSGIYKVLNAKDSAGDYIFLPNTKYFTRLAAFPEPMTETTLFRLESEVRASDRSWYAVDSDKVVINWDPTRMPDTIYPVYSGGVVTLLAYESFEADYKYAASEESSEDEVYLKVQLSRLPGSPASVTPELHRYNLKFSY